VLYNPIVPELPEVETIRKGLAAVLPNRIVQKVFVHDSRLWRRTGQDPTPALEKTRIISVERQGKWLFCPLDSPHLSTGTILAAHLRMSGKFLVDKTENSATHERHDLSHLRATLLLSDAYRVSFVDTRRFAEFLIFTPETGKTLRARLGPDALNISTETLFSAFQGRKGTLKAALCNQHLIAGIGNIYSDEALWRAKMRWDRPAGHLSKKDAETLSFHIRSVLKEAIVAGGTSAKDGLYRGVNEEKGWFALQLDVYQRTGYPCPRCSTPIERRQRGGSATHFCPTCQQS